MSYPARIMTRSQKNGATVSWATFRRKILFLTAVWLVSQTYVTWPCFIDFNGFIGKSIKTNMFILDQLTLP